MTTTDRDSCCVCELGPEYDGVSTTAEHCPDTCTCRPDLQREGRVITRGREPVTVHVDLPSCTQRFRVWRSYRNATAAVDRSRAKLELLQRAIEQLPASFARRDYRVRQVARRRRKRR